MPVEFEENNSFKNLYTQGNQSHSGIIGWLIKKNVVSNEKGANILLIVITVICILLSAYIFTAYGMGKRVFSKAPARSVNNLPSEMQARFQDRVPTNN